MQPYIHQWVFFCRKTLQWLISTSLFRFLLVGGSGLILNICVVYLLRHYINLILARMISYVIAFSVTWWLNRRTFHSYDPNKIKQWSRYASVYTCTGLLHIGLFAELVHQSAFLYRNPIWAILLTSGLIAFINFGLSKRFVFKPTL